MVRHSISRLALGLVPAAAFALIHCSGAVVPIGTNSSNGMMLQKNPDGTATGDGATCSFSGMSSKVGDSFMSSDGCNDCKCMMDGVYCTVRSCSGGDDAGTSGSGDCIYGGKSYKAGETFKSTDGCNSCGCNAGGPVTCTAMACAAPGCSYGGKTYAVGDSFKSTDGCNSCSCTASGQVPCTTMACATDAGPAPADCSNSGACPGPAPGAPNYRCADGTTGGPVCADNGRGTCGWMMRSCTCSYGGKTFQAGDSFPASDGCNTCSCGNDGQTSCTKRACSVDAGVDAGAYVCPPRGTTIDCMPGPSPQKPECAGPYHDWIVKNCPGVSFAM